MKEEDKVQLRAFKQKISDSKNKEKQFSQNIFNSGSSPSLYEDKTQTKPPSPEELNKEENAMLPTLSNFDWIMYPFVKSAKYFAQKLCGKKESKLD